MRGPIPKQPRESKICGTCKDEKSISEFYQKRYLTRNGQTNSHETDCKKCQSDKAKAYRNRIRLNPEKHSEFKRRKNESRSYQIRRRLRLGLPVYPYRYYVSLTTRYQSIMQLI